MSPTSIPPPPPPLGESLLRIFAVYFYWRPLWWLIKLRSQVRTVFRTLLGRGPRRPDGNQKS